MRRTYHYGTEGKPWYRITSRVVVCSSHDLAVLANQAAVDFHDGQGGKDAEWPVVISLFDEGMKHLGDVRVERSYDPVFSAYVVGHTHVGPVGRGGRA